MSEKIKLQMKTMKLVRGAVQSTEFAELEGVAFVDAVAMCQTNLRESQPTWTVIDTADGAIKTDLQGYVEIYTFRTLH